MRETRSILSLQKRLAEGLLGWGVNGVVSQRE